MTTLKLCLLIFVAGGLGALARFGLTNAVNRLVGHNLPMGTFAVNVLGSFLFGLVWAMAAERMLLADSTRVVLCVGFMGSFTTFSSLIFDSFNLGQTRPFLLGVNMASQLLLGFAALFGGIELARVI